jgi:hypothetical protein
VLVTSDASEGGFCTGFIEGQPQGRKFARQCHEFELDFGHEAPSAVSA